MPRLNYVFAGRTVIVLVLSCCGSFGLFASVIRDAKSFALMTGKGVAQLAPGQSQKCMKIGHHGHMDIQVATCGICRKRMLT